jgi:transcriptional regulator with XRE-family HTH domain
MASTEERTLGQVIRKRRRLLGLTQVEVARRTRTSTPYLGHLETGKRHPSNKMIARLAAVLGLDSRELFFLANPSTQELLRLEPESQPRSVWENFRRDNDLRRIHNISDDEMEVLSRVAMLGNVRSSSDFIFVLNAVRHALGR